MTDAPSDARRETLEHTLATDLEALREISARNLPSLASMTRAAMTADSRERTGGLFMTAFRGIRTRPWLATTLSAATVAVLLLFPISYERTVGHEITVTLAAPGLGGDQLQKIVTELKKTVGAESIRVEDHGQGPILKAQAPIRSKSQAERVASAFAGSLAAMGIPAESDVTPRVERVPGNLYALASENLIQININSEGKSAEEMEQEIRAQLAAAGVEFTTVDVEKEGDNTKILLKQEVRAAAGEPVADPPDVRVSIDGREPSGPDSKRVEIRVHRTEGMTDQQLIDEVKRQLDAQGVEADVTIGPDGKLQIHEHD